MFFLSIISMAHAEPILAESPQAIAIHFSERGFGHLGEGIAGLFPDVIPISGGSGSLDCSDETALDYTVGDIEINLNIDQIDIYTDNGRLVLDIVGTLDSPSTPFDASGQCAVLENLNENCTIAIPTTAFSIGTAVAIDLDGTVVTAEAEPLTFELSPITNPISDCLLSSVVGTLLGQNPAALSDLIVDAVEPSLSDIPSSIESTLQDAFGQLNTAFEVDLLGQPLMIELEPTKLSFEDSGLVLGLGSSMNFETDACVDLAQYSLPEGTDWPDWDGTAFQSQINYDAAVFLSESFVNQLLYGVWSSGVLCANVGELAGLPISGQLASTFFGDEVETLVGSDAPVDLFLRPQSPFYVGFSDDQPPLSIRIDDLALDAYGPVSDRLTRLLSVGIAADIGLEVPLDGNTLALNLALTEEDFFLSEDYSELLPVGYSQGVPGLLSLALSQALSPDLLPNFTIPSIAGIGLDTLFWEPNSEHTWIGGYLILDTSTVQPIEVTGCSADGFGCDGGPTVDFDFESQLGCSDVSSGCEDSGCASSGPIRLPAGRILGLFVIGIGALIRRQD